MITLLLVLFALQATPYVTTLPFRADRRQEINEKAGTLLLKGIDVAARATDDGAKVSLSLDVENVGDRDLEAELSVTLLSSAGAEMVSEEDSLEIEEGDEKTVGFRMTLKGRGPSDVASVRLRVRLDD